jgi:hypothetical protein
MDSVPLHGRSSHGHCDRKCRHCGHGLNFLYSYVMCRI